MMMSKATDTTHAPWAQAILAFWFEELTPDDWFSGEAKIDDAIRSRFAETFETQSRDIPAGALDDAKTALAAIILFDQFSRNLFRGTAKAFSADELAITIARNALDRGFDAGMSKDEKTFLFMPFEHSEILSDGERSVSLFKSLDDEELVKYAVEHRDIIAKFGRYPHRNKPLGRESTDAEKVFLGEHKGFGQ
jgi:uncharacterized protein (DUF924 family)